MFRDGLAFGVDGSGFRVECLALKARGAGFRFNR